MLSVKILHSFTLAGSSTNSFGLFPVLFKNFKTPGWEICNFSEQFAPKASYLTDEFICQWLLTINFCYKFLSLNQNGFSYDLSSPMEMFMRNNIVFLQYAFRWTKQIEVYQVLQCKKTDLWLLMCLIFKKFQQWVLHNKALCCCFRLGSKKWRQISQRIYLADGLPILRELDFKRNWFTATFAS